MLHATSRPFLFLALAAGPIHGQVSVSEFPLPSPGSRPYSIVAGADGNLWFTESNGNRLGRITTAGVVTEFPVPTPQSAPYGIAVGADGLIWFTERLADQIGRFDPATGQFAEFPVPTPFSQPWDIALGADGNLWFTEDDVNQIGRITPQGVVSEFVPPTCCFPIGIAAGADGNVWFAQEIGDQIGRVEPSGAITMFPIQSVQVLPWDVAPGPDGAVWFTELAGRAIGRVSPSGTIVEYPIPGAFSGIAGIATGPDANLWFTENDTHHVGAIDPAGNLLALLDVGDRPLGLALGPDGNLWFTEADGNAIGRVNIAHPAKRHVLALDAGFVPRSRVATLGDSVQWTFLGPNPHSVVDASGLGLFDSGAQPIVSSFEHRFRAASTFLYRDAGAPARSAISVPVALPSSAAAGVAFLVTWALADPPPGIEYEAQVKPPGSPAFVPFASGTVRRASYTAVTPGTYRFRARMRSLSNGDATLFSRPATIVVH